MNLKFFKKIKKTPSTRSFHQKPISPEVDWLVILLICLIYIGFSIAMSFVLFITSINTDATGLSEASDTQNDSSQSININKLNSALEFINSRGK